MFVSFSNLILVHSENKKRNLFTAGCIGDNGAIDSARRLSDSSKCGIFFFIGTDIGNEDKVQLTRSLNGAVA